MQFPSPNTFQRNAPNGSAGASPYQGVCGRARLLPSRDVKSSLGLQAFTILEMMIVIGIIGLMAAMALPHLKGFTSGSAMTAATRQLLDDVNLARQRAMANRSQVCMVFLPPGFWNTQTPSYQNNAQISVQTSNLFFHQYSAYALIALRSVGDQPGRSNVHYLTDWRVLPKGVYIAPFQFTNVQITNVQFGTNYVYTTNTTTGITNPWPIVAFPTNVSFPFPTTFSNYNAPIINFLPYIGFTPSGQLFSTPQGLDQFVMLTSGSIFNSLTATGAADFTSTANLVETPPNNEFNNANLIHIDWLTGRARIEHNQF